MDFDKIKLGDFITDGTTAYRVTGRVRYTSGLPHYITVVKLSTGNTHRLHASEEGNLPDYRLATDDDLAGNLINARSLDLEGGRHVWPGKAHSIHNSVTAEFVVRGQSPRKERVEAILAVYESLGRNVERRLSQAIADITAEYPCYELGGPGRETVNSPDHYNSGSMETIESIERTLTPEEYQGFLRGNIIKYLHRADHKGKREEDLAKATWYKDRLYDACK